MNTKVLCLATLLIVAAFANLGVEESFGNFVSKHNKNYESEEEYNFRFHVYSANLEYIENHNRRNAGFSLGMNEFGDLTAMEFGLLYNTLQQQEQSGAFHEINAAAPDSQDWRPKGAVTGVKNQGQCGSCWAFSTTGSTEGAYFLAGNTLVGLSEQNLMDCSNAYGNMGCNGGLMDSAFKYIINNNGVDTEASYPYTAQDGSCNFNKANVGATISSFKDIPSQNEDALTNAIGTVGPISVAIDASHSSFQFYQSGVYYEPNCSPTQLDHGVLAVGYNTASQGGDYYIVKNSWGTSWGNAGYIWMARNKQNNCGIATAASYPIV